MNQTRRNVIKAGAGTALALAAGRLAAHASHEHTMLILGGTAFLGPAGPQVRTSTLRAPPSRTAFPSRTPYPSLGAVPRKAKRRGKPGSLSCTASAAGRGRVGRSCRRASGSR